MAAETEALATAMDRDEKLVGPGTYEAEFNRERFAAAVIAALAALGYSIVRTPPPVVSPNTPCSTCGHLKRFHIYDEGACRPGFVCDSDCREFAAARAATP